MTRFTRENTGHDIVTAFAEEVKGKTILITGTSSGGIGAETALALAHGNPRSLLLAGRSENNSSSVLNDIKKISPETRVEFVHVKLDDLDSVRKAAVDIHQVLGDENLDILINNAAIIGDGHMEKTADGVESVFGINHLGHFLLTNLLMDRLWLNGKAGRVVNLTSTAYEASIINFDDVNFEDGKKYDRWASYGQSKLANMFFTASLVERYGNKDLTAFSVHPGVINGTGLAAHIPDEAFAEAWANAKKMEETTGRVFRKDPRKTVQQGCATTLVAALDPALQEHNGAHLRDCNLYDEVVEHAKDPAAAEQLWHLSEKLVSQRFE